MCMCRVSGKEPWLDLPIQVLSWLSFLLICMWVIDHMLQLNTYIRTTLLMHNSQFTIWWHWGGTTKAEYNTLFTSCAEFTRCLFMLCTKRLPLISAGDSTDAISATLWMLLTFAPWRGHFNEIGYRKIRKIYLVFNFCPSWRSGLIRCTKTAWMQLTHWPFNRTLDIGTVYNVWLAGFTVIQPLKFPPGSIISPSPPPPLPSTSGWGILTHNSAVNVKANNKLSLNMFVVCRSTASFWWADTLETEWLQTKNRIMHSTRHHSCHVSAMPPHEKPMHADCIWRAIRSEIAI